MSVEPIVRVLSAAAIRGCEFFILDPDHYREEGTCRCDDPDHEEMDSWGYVWSDEKGRWTA